MVAIPHVKVAFGDLAGRLSTADSEVTVPRELVARLLDLYICCWDFDEDWYLATYPDVEEAIRQGLFVSGWNHFRSVGYVEGRLGSPPSVDTEWYMSAYPDIAQAILQGKIDSAQEHYVAHGYSEGRLSQEPNIHARWYASRYMNSIDPNAIEVSACMEHFVHRGYRQLALPAPPR